MSQWFFSSTLVWVRYVGTLFCASDWLYAGSLRLGGRAREFFTCLLVQYYHCNSLTILGVSYSAAYLSDTSLTKIMQVIIITRLDATYQASGKMLIFLVVIVSAVRLAGGVLIGKNKQPSQGCIGSSDEFQRNLSSTAPIKALTTLGMPNL
ncbi:uncharacterized protein EDB91DRAFT_1084183 [Suillus paluster]|uniref:uncharacterized protein n=1 Tax=Suillus paluster TaxID=48578 RepID=UPI001B880736|nr:uncharacterized protein EDB91DRAFT_1084183 [Suillus paluster]KAG1734036.1 hypothetical protein EDB91DRAFT_1084183 [Suillus paluster]